MSNDIPRAGAPDDDRDHRPLPKVELPSINREPVSDRSNAGYLAHTPGLEPETPPAAADTRHDEAAAAGVDPTSGESVAEPTAREPGAEPTVRQPDAQVAEPDGAAAPAEAEAPRETTAPHDEPAPPRRRGAVIGTVVVVVAAIAGTVVYWAMQSGLIG